MVGAVAAVEARLEYLNFLTRDLRPAEAANELFALPAEHAASDNFDPAVVGMGADVHCYRSQSSVKLVLSRQSHP